MNNNEDSDKCLILATTEFFNYLSADELKQLSHLFSIEAIAPKQQITQEGELAEAFYIIVSGKAEVWVNRSNQKSVLVTTLSKGDTIGHIDTNSPDATYRNASVVAETAMTIMRAAVADLVLFLKKHADVQVALKAFRHRTGIINFIKTATPLVTIDYHTANDLVEKLEVKDVAAGEDIVLQGALSETCYFIEKGTVSVIIKDDKGQEKCLKELERGDLFGELGLFDGEPRNATCRAKTDCVLYCLERHHFLALLSNHQQVAQTVSHLSKHRNRPTRTPEVEIIRQRDMVGEKIYILKNPKSQQYLRLQHDGWFLWQQMNGINTIHEIILSYLNEYGKFMPQQIMNLILDLEEFGMVDMNYYKPRVSSKLEQLKNIRGLSNMIEIKFNLNHTDQMFSTIYRYIGHLIYNKKTIISLIAFILIGLVCFSINAPSILRKFKTIDHNYVFLFYIYLILPFTIGLHEFAHGLTTKAVGCKVGGYGFGWNWFGPMAFCDTTDTWLASAKDRIKVNVAGFFSDLCFAAIASLLALVFSGSQWGIFFWLLASLFYVTCILNLGTLIELDGYYILADLLDEPNLRRKSFLWLDKMPKQLFQPSMLRKNYKFAVYWLVTIVHLIIAVSVYSYFQNNILFNFLPPKVSDSAIVIKLIVPAIMVILIVYSIWKDRNQYRK